MSTNTLAPQFDALLSVLSRIPSRDFSAVQTSVDLLETAQAMFRCLEERFFKDVVSKGKFMVLTLLMDAPESQMTPSELASKAGVTRATMTGLLDRLETEGHVTRAQSQEDRRKLTINLTQAGQDFLQDVLPRLAELLESIGASLPAGNRGTLNGLLGSMKEALS
ncbi:MarR family winged helix-turn-helix transcriptional regulator [Desulfobaculum bizertense]|uniref:DNA-binding transcriptional regulator, MarR family n=1 Tax=Desulfobaculum bizertense DSM 18034 TaxID=1121442 RepID=A0A1T4VJQ2_9BACT|nr:MarR family transcriptional regulator [Desulfobaculum bizertense]UIJ38021.1 MarR family transcriptional regulator [Desulfobaculum bizertense]SKA65153.1 DNA-binding transcriptional regulator, MarR family [Desulfobaculum bizertense DSM 18034]